MSYDKKKLNKFIKDIKNDLVIFCDNKKLLTQNMKKYENIKFFVETHKKKKYDYSDLLKLAELEFYIAEIDISIALSEDNYREAYSIYNKYFQNSNRREHLFLRIQSSLNQYLNVAKEHIQNEPNFDYRYKRINKIRNNIPDEACKELELYVDELNIKYSVKQITKLTQSNNYKLAFDYALLLKDKKIQKSCINIILDGTKEFINDLFQDLGYPKCKKEINKILSDYPTKYKEQILQYCGVLKNVAIVQDNIDSKLKNYDFQEADYIYKQNTKIIDENFYKNKKSTTIKQYFNKCWDIDINDEQAKSLSNISQNVLVTARAGSGKTRTIACRAILAMEKEDIKPNEILLLSFNRNAAEEMRQRIATFGFKNFDKNSARTFHSLAHDIVKPQEELIYDDGDKDVKQKLTKFIDEIYSSKETLTEDFKNNLYEYYRWTPDSRDIYTKYWVFKSDEEKYTYLRHKKYVTLNREKVKSNGEKWIADFLFEHDIKYKYEKLLTCSSYRENFYNSGKLKMYHPDFTIWNKEDKTTYIIEHWGIDENDSNKKVPKYWKKTWDEYYKEMQWKRNIISKRQDVCLIETSICDLTNGRDYFEKILKNRLESHGILCNKISKEEVLKRIADNYINDLSKNFAQFILYAQKESFTPEDIDNKLKNDVFKGNKRSEAFVKMANVIYKKYHVELEKKHKIDFDHILFNATKKILDSQGNCEISMQNKRQKIKNLKMILIDEYQDFSQLFYNMIDAILKFNPNIKLFCVGDDWQAINAFAGSNLKFFQKFNTYFKNSGSENLSYNYRSCKNIVLSGNQLMKNDGVPSNYINEKEGIFEQYFIDDVNIFKENTREIDEEFIYDNEKTQDQKPFFGINHRYFKKCIEIISQDVKQRYFIMHREKEGKYINIQHFANAIGRYFKNKGINVDIIVNTVHKFKGMEADSIIILEATKDKFPLIHPDTEFYLIFNKTPQMILDDEKRLFYVALTRAKKNVYILTERANYCEYLIPIKDFISNTKLVPQQDIYQHLLNDIEDFEDLFKMLDNY